MSIMLKKLFGQKKQEARFYRDTFRERLNDLIVEARRNRMSARDIAELLEQKADTLRVSHATQTAAF
jgi:hypothetical protein